MRLMTASGGLLMRAVDFVFGYDFFVSYKHEDGGNYPTRLARILTDKGFRVFLDKAEYRPGDDLRIATKRRVRMSSSLVVVARPGALLRSEWVEREIAVSADAGGSVIVIDVDGAFEAAVPANDDEAQRQRRVRAALHGRLRLPEPTGTALPGVYDGEPSARVCDELGRGFHATRQDTRRVRVFAGIAVALAVLAALATFSAVRATRAQQAAEREARWGRAGELAAKSRLAAVDYPQRAVLLAVAAVESTARDDGGPAPEAKQALQEAVFGIRGEPIGFMRGAINAASLAGDDAGLLTGDAYGAVALWSIVGDTDKPLATANTGNSGVTWLSHIPRTDAVAVLNADGNLCLWHTRDTAGKCQSLAPGSQVLDVAITPDGSALVAAANGNTVFVWRAAALGEPPIRVTDLYTVRTIQFSSDGRWMVAVGIVSSDVWVWDLARWPAITQPLVVHDMTGIPSAASIDAVREIVVVADDKCIVRAHSIAKVSSLSWITELTRPPLVACGRKGSVNAMGFSTDGSLFGTGIFAGDERFEIVLRQGERTATIALDHQVTHIAPGPDGGSLYVQGTAGHAWIVRWVGSVPVVVELFGRAEAIQTYVFSGDGRFLYTADISGDIERWDLRCPRRPSVTILRGHEGHVSDLFLTADGRWLVSTSGDGSARRWSLASPVPGDPFGLIGSCHDEVDSAVASPGRRWLATNNATGRLAVFDLGHRDVFASRVEVVCDPSDRNVEIDFTRDEQHLLVTTSSGKVCAWDLPLMDPRPPVLGSKHVGVAALDRAVSADANWVASSSYDEIEVRHRAQPGHEPTRLSFPDSGRIDRIAFVSSTNALTVVFNQDTVDVWTLGGGSPPVLSYRSDPARLATVSNDGRYVVEHDVDAGVLVLRPLARPDAAHAIRLAVGSSVRNASVLVSDDERHIAVASGSLLRVWLLADPRRTPFAFDPLALITAMSFSADGRWLALGTDAGHVGLWRIANGRIVQQSWLAVDDGAIKVVGFDPASRWLFDAAHKQIRIWPVDTGALKLEASRRVGRTLSAEERMAYEVR